jgi:hypothetical protein
MLEKEGRTIRIEFGMFVRYIEDEPYVLGIIEQGITPADSDYHQTRDGTPKASKFATASPALPTKSVNLPHEWRRCSRKAKS